MQIIIFRIGCTFLSYEYIKKNLTYVQYKHFNKK
jgi:hypothetical protein